MLCVPIHTDSKITVISASQSDFLQLGGNFIRQARESRSQSKNTTFIMKTIKETAKAMQSIYNDCYYKITGDEPFPKREHYISEGQILMFEQTDLIREFNTLIGCPIDSSDEFGAFALAYEIVTKQ